MPVSAVSFGEWLSDLPGPPLGPRSTREPARTWGGGVLSDILSDSRPTLRLWCLWFGSHALRRARWSPPVCPPGHVTFPHPVHLPASGELSAHLVAWALRGLWWCWPCGGHLASPLAGPTGLCSGSWGWAGSSIGRWPLPSRRKRGHDVCSQVTGGPRPENAWETVTHLQPTR